MENSVIIQSIILVIIGFALGIFFFAGSRMAIRLMRASPAPQIIWLSSMLIRFAVVGGGIWIASGQTPEKVAIMAFGLVAAKLAMLWPRVRTH